MKPMLKTAFFSLVNDLLARGITPELNASTLTSYGSLKWSEGDTTRVEELYSVRDCSPLTASTFRKRFTTWFESIMAAHHAAAAEKLTEGQKVMDGDVVRTVTGFRTTILRDANGIPKNQKCPRTGVIILDGKIEAMAGAVKHYMPDSDVGDAVKAINAQFNKENGEALGALHDMLHSAMDRMEMDDLHAEALVMDATFEENLVFLATLEMADIWNEHTDTLKVRILDAAHAEALAMDAEYGNPARFEYVNANGHKQTQLLAAAHAEALGMNEAPTTLKELCGAVSELAPANPELVEALNAVNSTTPMDATDAIRHMANTLTRHIEQSEQPGFDADAAYRDIKANYDDVAERCKDRAITVWLINHLCFGYIGDTYTFAEINKPYRDQFNHILDTGWRPEESATLTLTTLFEMDWWGAADITVTKHEGYEVYGTATVTDTEGMYQIAFEWLMNMGEDADRVGLPAIVNITSAQFTLPHEVILHRGNGTALDTLEAVQEMDCVLGLSADIFNEVYDKYAPIEGERL